MNLFNRYAPIIVTAGLVVWLERFVTIEWSYPYCLDQTDGPAYAAQGMPLPYWMWNGVASLEHNFVPHVYILNVVILCLLMFPAVGWIVNRVSSPRARWLRNVIGIIGCLLLLSHASLMILFLSNGYYRPVKSLGLEGYYHYSDFRPVRFGFIKSNAPGCTASSFWFPDGWRQN